MGLRLQLRKQQAEAGDIVLLYGDESEALTHPYLARAWAKSGADLRVPAPGQAKKVAMLGSLDHHVPRQELPRVLLELHATLKPGGVLFSSNPRGDNKEGWTSGRYSVFHDLELWRRYASAAGFVELTHYYGPDGAPREQQPWLASVWRRLAP